MKYLTMISVLFLLVACMPNSREEEEMDEDTSETNSVPLKREKGVDLNP